MVDLIDWFGLMRLRQGLGRRARGPGLGPGPGPGQMPGPGPGQGPGLGLGAVGRQGQGLVHMPREFEAFASNAFRPASRLEEDVIVIVVSATFLLLCLLRQTMPTSYLFYITVVIFRSMYFTTYVGAVAYGELMMVIYTRF